MNDQRKMRRVEKLLAIGRGDERAAQQAFDVARAGADKVRDRLVELELEMNALNETGRQRLAEGGRDGAGESYRQGVAKLRRSISRTLARQRVAEVELEGRRAELLAAMTRRRAAEILRERLQARQAAGEARLETRQMDEAHAAGERLRTGQWRQDVSGVERHGT